MNTKISAHPNVTIRFVSMTDFNIIFKFHSTSTFNVDANLHKIQKQIMEKITNLTFFLKFGNWNDTRLYFDHNIRCIVAFKLKDNNFSYMLQNNLVMIFIVH